MHKLCLIALFLFPPLAAMLNPAISSSDGICHLARLPTEIRDRIAKFALYESYYEATNRIEKNHFNRKNKAQSDPLNIPGIPPNAIVKFSPSKTYMAYFRRTNDPGERWITIVGPSYGEITNDHPSHIHATQIAAHIQFTLGGTYIAFNKQRTRIYLFDDGGWYQDRDLPDCFLEEKYTGSCAENSLKEFFLRKLVCKRLENSKGTHA